MRRPLALALSLALLAPVAAPLARGQDKNMGKKDEKDEKSEQEKLAADMNKEARRFLASVKISAKEAIAHATRQPGVVTAIRAEQQMKKDKAGKEEKVDVFEVTVVREQTVTTVQVDAEGRTTEKPAPEDEVKDAKQVVKRLTSAKAVLSIPVVVEKIAAHEKAQVISVLLEDREERKDKKGEAYLVYALVGDEVAWYEVDATSGEVEKKKT